MTDQWSVCRFDGCGASVRRKTKSAPWIHAIYDPTVTHDPIPASDPDWRPARPMPSAEAFARIEACLGPPKR